MVGAYVDAHRGDRPGDGGRDGLPRGTTARTARIAALPLAFTGRAVAGWGRRLAGADPETVSAGAMERNAEQLFAVLGQLRGGAMKVGQALAVYESMMPAELAEPYRRALVARVPPWRGRTRTGGDRSRYCACDRGLVGPGRPTPPANSNPKPRAMSGNHHDFLSLVLNHGRR